jgi:molybdopterin-guanine dinucleotide biosynthesis protein A
VIQASAVILAGGKGRRMGQAKATLMFGGQTLLERLAAELAKAFSDLVVVGPPESTGILAAAPLGTTLLRDELPFRGMLPALASGLAAAREEVVLAVGCDLALLRSEVARALCDALGDFDALLPEVGGHLQPLAAVYRRKPALAAFRKLLELGEYRMGRVALFLETRILCEDEIRPFDPALLSFLNLNTPEDYREALRLAGF